MSVDNTNNENLNVSEISEVVRVKVAGDDYLKFNQLIPNLVLGKKMADAAKKNQVSILGIKCFIKIMDVVTSAGKQFIQADAEGILATFVQKSSNDYAYAKLVKAIQDFKVNEDGSVLLSAKEHEALLSHANIAIQQPQ